MKKSTLITTIAMIVVVVVALSTATYAWFTSASKATASAGISVVSSSGWLLANGTKNLVTDTEHTYYDEDHPNIGTDIITFDPNYADPIQLKLLNGLYSPASELTTSIANEDGFSQYQNAQWYTAQQSGVQVQATAKVAETPKYAIYKGSEQGAGFETPVSYIKIKNSSDSSKTLRLTITVYVNATVAANSAQLAAAQRLCAYITYYDGTSNVAHTQYSYGTVSDVTATRVDIDKSTAGTGTVALGGTPANGALPTFTPCDDSTHKLEKSFTGETSDITTGSFYQYTLDIAGVDREEEISMSLCVWFDGWHIFSASNGAEANVYLAFSDGPIAG